MLALVGILVFLWGAHFLWQARKEVLYWLGEFVRILRASLRQPEQSPGTPALVAEGVRPSVERGRDTLRLVSAVGLILLGQVLVLLELAWRLYPKFSR